MSQRQLPVIVALGTTQTLAWASSYYLPAILADPIAYDLGISSNWFFAAFSAAMVISGLLGPRVGRQIDLFGGRPVLSGSNVIFAAGLALLGASTSGWMLGVAWFLLGIGMATGLYDAAFSALGRIYGDNARRAITGITLIAGFASTVGWPLSSWGLETIGWRNTCYAWAAAHLLIGLPLNLLFLPKVAVAKRAEGSAVKPHIQIDRPMILLSLAFAAAWTVTSAMAAHLPRIVEAFGATPAQAVFAGMMIGPAQVAARVLEASTLGRFHPLFSTRLACITHPIGACVIGIFGGPAAVAFALLHGAGNGLLTISRGTLPLAIFGPENFGYRLGLLGAPSRVCQAVAPLGFSLLIDSFGGGVVVASSMLSLVAFGALLFMPMPTAKLVMDDAPAK
ncbi:major facilitator superfamily MFS_1 [Afipia carboxidovorans OM5]|uniref:Putative MFS transporter protein n=1 Tax=Afipia carboxidovorans (strain ATCC 49405 / DSM 1227 / KCTC 32145 / OM5) TaxID=504832 RepID=B6JK95_AFIC5|nr:MFS transporter [Afipia carboxidovorans]ACI94839.1 major facilitator superfamily MFS_1 [Afipia carboxidovorans OM5]AEI04642.1 putative MFS transporter protein [Afipia carboxidovorans OM4]AEI08271.1 putative MFS transporter protein [Afipia carboxidovorans OM5]